MEVKDLGVIGIKCIVFDQKHWFVNQKEQDFLVLFARFLSD